MNIGLVPPPPPPGVEEQTSFTVVDGDAGGGFLLLCDHAENRVPPEFGNLGLPDSDGYQVLQEKNADAQLARIPVIVVSARDPLGNPIVTGRQRVVLVGGLSTRDIARCAAAISHAFSEAAGSTHPVRPATFAD